MPAAGAAVGVALFGAGTAAAAVTAAVVTGAIVGAVVGAATALISGGDILKGALTGAALGGVTAGIVKYASLPSAVPPTSSLGTSTGAGAGAGAEVSAAANAEPAALLGTEGAARYANIGTQAGYPLATPVGLPQAPTAPVTQAASGGGGLLSGMSDSTAKILAGTAQGGMESLGKFLSAQEETDAAKELAEYTQKMNISVPGKFQDQTSKMNIPSRWSAETNWWDEHLLPTQYSAQKGLLT